MPIGISQKGAGYWVHNLTNRGELISTSIDEEERSKYIGDRTFTLNWMAKGPIVVKKNDSNKLGIKTQLRDRNTTRQQNYPVSNKYCFWLSETRENKSIIDKKIVSRD